MYDRTCLADLISANPFLNQGVGRSFVSFDNCPPLSAFHYQPFPLPYFPPLILFLSSPSLIPHFLPSPSSRPVLLILLFLLSISSSYYLSSYPSFAFQILYFSLQ
jgi:hypothetical protein